MENKRWNNTFHMISCKKQMVGRSCSRREGRNQQLNAKANTKQSNTFIYWQQPTWTWLNTFKVVVFEPLVIDGKCMSVLVFVFVVFLVLNAFCHHTNHDRSTHSHTNTNSHFCMHFSRIWLVVASFCCFRSFSSSSLSLSSVIVCEQANTQFLHYYEILFSCAISRY